MPALYRAGVLRSIAVQYFGMFSLPERACADVDIKRRSPITLEHYRPLSTVI